MRNFFIFTVFLLVGIVYGDFCPEGSGNGIDVVAESEAEAIAFGGIATSKATAKALGDFKNGFCDGDVTAAANAFALAAQGGSADALATAQAFSDASDSDVNAAANAAALAFKGAKSQAEANAVAKVLGQAAGLHGGAAANAAANAFAQAVGGDNFDHLGGSGAAAKAFADAYAAADIYAGGFAFVQSAADAAAIANCDKFKDVLAEAYTLGQAVGLYGGLADAAAAAESSAECYQGCCQGE